MGGDEERVGYKIVVGKRATYLGDLGVAGRTILK
jgi:hypothetical protein